MKKLLYMLSLVLIFLLLSGCAAQAAHAQAPVETNQVTLPPSYLFEPATIQVKVGETVTWTNKDNFTHNIHLLGGINWVSKPLRPGESVTYTFTKAGTFPYVCDFHSHDMKGEVIVMAK